MSSLARILVILCLIGAVLSVGVDVDHCSPQGTLYRMDRENFCKDCCCIKKDGKVDYTPKCTIKKGCKPPTPIDWTKMKKVFANKLC
ncbi:Hypothetical protein NTJ_03733 [Nesidiocoris tenuis]|uniref:Uncharacterized protein n=1 Tax=Nesidiocoris tenuis TaxID=355587 RepID=A0ABN7AF76_9HEMI|nr:Hypothetical protein NTJ_03733 [Nesidiocoris tenuis]